MQNYKKPIPDLKKKQIIWLIQIIEYINIGSCIFIVTIIVILVFSIITVAAIPNSNFPATI